MVHTGKTSKTYNSELRVYNSVSGTSQRDRFDLTQCACAHDMANRLIYLVVAAPGCGEYVSKIIFHQTNY